MASATDSFLNVALSFKYCTLRKISGWINRIPVAAILKGILVETTGIPVRSIGYLFEATGFLLYQVYFRLN